MDALLDIADVAPAVANPALRALAQEDAVLASVRDCLPDGVGIGQGVRINRWSADAVLIDLSTGEKVLVEVRNHAQFSSTLADIIPQAKELDKLIVGGLLLVNGEMGDATRARFETAGWVVYNASDLSADEGATFWLQKAIRNAFSSVAKE